MSAHQQVVDTNGISAYPTDPQVDMRPRFVPDVYNLLLEGATAVDYSFDGVNDHGRLTPNEPNEMLPVRSKAQRLWFKSAAVLANTVRVQVTTDV